MLNSPQGGLAMATQKREFSHLCRMALWAVVVVLIAGPLAAQTPTNDAQQQWQQLNARRSRS
jgi:hypothetical protein